MSEEVGEVKENSGGEVGKVTGSVGKIVDVRGKEKMGSRSSI